MILDKVNSPAELKTLAENEFPELATEIRKILLDKLSCRGGHIGPNLTYRSKKLLASTGTPP